MPASNRTPESDKGRAGFSTFAGVFTPTVLTILGLILFLRVGWVVGQAGLAGALIIIAIANIITLFTGLSLSSIATNMRVKTGGTYYMIARTLGLEIGGAIGIPLYLSQAISVAFYIIGFTEAFHTVFPSLEPKLVSSVVLLLFCGIAFFGADFIIKIQFGILAIMGLALFSFFAGYNGEITTPSMFAPNTATASFWQVFAIFFPAVTGITVGVSMSGDLKDPTVSIPKGTMAAIGITALIYLCVALFLGLQVKTDLLQSEPMIMQKSARWPVFVLAGVWVSTLSSALGSILAAPRTLQALAADNTAPRFLGSNMGSATEPRMAVIVTGLLSLAVIWMGSLDFVASLIAMFFLNTYGMINLMAGFEKVVGNPSFRPKFNVHWAISLLGAFGCYGAMFLINPIATLVAIFISYGIFIGLKRRSLEQDWGDIRGGIWLTLARFGLLGLKSVPQHTKNWRPNIVVFTSLYVKRPVLMEVGGWLASGRGILTYYNLILGGVEQRAAQGFRAVASAQLHNLINESGINAFSGCAVVDEFQQGVLHTMQTHGIAGLEPNTAMMAWGDTPESRLTQLQLTRALMTINKSMLLLYYNPDFGFGKKKRIDIWWRSLNRNTRLMLVLAHVIAKSQPWEGSTIRILSVQESKEDKSWAEEYISQLLRSARLEAEPVVLLKTSPEDTYQSVLKHVSQEADLIMRGMSVPKEEAMDEQMREIDGWLQGANSTLLVRSGVAEDILDTTTVWAMRP